MDILGQKYTKNYPGGPVAFLNKWEEAGIKLQNVASLEGYSDNTKRSLFVQNFLLLGVTDQMVEDALDFTITWDQLSSSLRTKIAWGNNLEKRDSNLQLRIQQVYIQEQEKFDHNIAELYVKYVRDQSWNMGNNL